MQKLAHRRQLEEYHEASRSNTSSGTVSPSSSQSPSPYPKSPKTPQTQKNDGSLAPVQVIVIRDEGSTSSHGHGGLRLLSPKSLPAALIDETSRSTSTSPSSSRSPAPSAIRLPPGYLEGSIKFAEDDSRSDREDRTGEDRTRDVKVTDPGGSSQEDHGVEEGAYLRSKLWWLGMLLITVGEGGNFLSYGFAPASVVAPLGTVVRCSLFLV